jgi:sulfoxide reductase catalytic subunit YedY
MLIRRPSDIRPSEITDKDLYLTRRRFLRGAAATAGVLIAGGLDSRLAFARGERLADVNKTAYGKGETPNSYEDVTTYNNFYEFGTGKSDPSRNAGDFNPSPWSVQVSGEAEVTGEFTLEDILAPHALEERIYRLRCVEAWSMVIPWVGFPLGDLLKRFRPLSSARYVEFRTLYDPKRMPGQRWPVLDWPYVEGLRIAEAVHPLTLMAVGVYREVLPNQNGAPMRLVVPWKYGFKSIKSIDKIIFRESPPKSSWMKAAPNEYGFYANVNPEVDHPRWSQKRERRIGAGVFDSKVPTKKFNGYGEQVASLYSGMDLARHF